MEHPPKSSLAPQAQAPYLLQEIPQQVASGDAIQVDPRPNHPSRVLLAVHYSVWPFLPRPLHKDFGAQEYAKMLNRFAPHSGCLH